MKSAEAPLPPLIDSIDALLPQTQCRRCGYEGCRPYAEAIAAGAAQINRCPPGGSAGIQALARLTGTTTLPLDPECGAEGPALLAYIDAPACIGCARCLPACPVDAILGARQFMHTVLMEDCNGCGLCVPVCPVDCISLRQRPAQVATPSAAENRGRFQAHRSREQRVAADRQRLLAERKRAAQSPA